MNIYLNLPLPINVVIDFDLIPPPPVTRREEQLRMMEAVEEVGGAVRRWEWENALSESD